MSRIQTYLLDLAVPSPASANAHTQHQAIYATGQRCSPCVTDCCFAEMFAFANALVARIMRSPLTLQTTSQKLGVYALPAVAEWDLLCDMIAHGEARHRLQPGEALSQLSLGSVQRMSLLPEGLSCQLFQLTPGPCLRCRRGPCHHQKRATLISLLLARLAVVDMQRHAFLAS